LGKALWSPQKDERGADIYKNMRAVKKGDIVLHLVDNETIAGVSIVDKECDTDFFVLPGTEWDDGTAKRPGYLVVLEGYKNLKSPIDRKDLLQEKYRQRLTKLLDEGHDLFYNVNLNLRQGAYLTEVPDGLLGMINDVYKNKTGEDLPYFFGMKPQITEGKYAILWSANINLHPRVIEYPQENIRRMGATYWGVGFSIDTTRITLPVNGYLYTTDRRKVTHIAKIEDVETYDKPQMPREASLRPPEYKDEVHRTYFRLSRLENLSSPIEIHDFTQWNGEKVVRPPQNYVLVLEPTARPAMRPLNLEPALVSTRLRVNEELRKQICASLNCGSHIIITGPVGTGKTSFAEDVCRAAQENDFCDGYILTTASSDWTTFDTIGGYMATKEQKLAFEEGKFLEAIRKNKWLVIDEINRADIDKAFGQLFTILSGQNVELPFKHSNGKTISIQVVDEDESNFDETTAAYKVGRNWRIIATMNIYDMNFLFEMSYAFMRRFAFVYMDVPANFGELIEAWCTDSKLSGKTADRLKKLTNLADRKLGPAIIKDIVDFLVHRGDGEKELAEAIIAYVLPQLKGLEKERIKKAWNQIGLIFDDKTVPNMVIRPILREIVGIELAEVSEPEKVPQ
jgi:MoxR-like ATPase